MTMWPNERSGVDAGSALCLHIGRPRAAAPDHGRWPCRTMKAFIQHRLPVPRGQCLSRGALPRRVRAAVAGAWVGNRDWEDGFGNWKRGPLRHTTCRAKRRCGHTSNSAFSGVSGVKGFKLQRLGTFVGFGVGMRRGPGKSMYSPEEGAGAAQFRFGQPARSTQRRWRVRLQIVCHWPGARERGSFLRHAPTRWINLSWQRRLSGGWDLCRLNIAPPVAVVMRRWCRAWCRAAFLWQTTRSITRPHCGPCSVAPGIRVGILH
jgi:hypothetical protein